MRFISLIIWIIIVGTLALAGYAILFKSIANKRLKEKTAKMQEEESRRETENYILPPENVINSEPVHNKMADPSSVRTGFFFVVVIVLLIICVWTVISSNEKIKMIDEKGQQTRLELLNRISSLEDTITSQQDYMASPLALASVDYGEYDVQTHSIEVIYRIVPKEIAQDTEVTMQLGNRQEVFSREGNTFVCRVKEDIFAGTKNANPVVAVTSQGLATSYECSALNTWNIGYEYMPHCEIFMDCLHDSLTGTSVTQELSITAYTGPGKLGNWITDMHIVTEKNGEVIFSDTMKQDIPDIYHYDYNRTISIEPGDTVAVYLERQDTLGYTYKTMISYPTSQAMGWDDNSSEWIYDAEGNLLSER